LVAWDSLQKIEELASEHAAEDLDRQEEGMPGVNPVGGGWIEAAGRNDAVDVGMMTPTPTVP
jgi:hypothetical protein